MNFRRIPPGLSRREILAGACAAAGSIALSQFSSAREPSSKDGDSPYDPFRMGLQSYSLRGYTKGGRPDLQKSLAITRQLGLHFWEAFPAHVPQNLGAESLDSLKREFQDADVKVIGYGVVHLSKAQDANRRIFDFARMIGVEYLSADPDPSAFDAIDRLVEEYGIGVGIHNHGPGHRFAKIESIAKAIKDHHAKIGCCIDTGHFLRSREDPVHAVEVFGDRVYGVHLKDVKDAEKFTILGGGDLQTVDLLKALLARKYRYCLALEYEESPEDPLADIQACLAETKKAIAAASKG
jgi:sugar phosphate isomerase/epimerase